VLDEGFAAGALGKGPEAERHTLLRAGQKGRAAPVLKTVGGTDGTADLTRLWMRVP
jgi:hypothetical protein